MTIQSALVLATIVSAFLIFGITLTWVDFYTQRRPKPTALVASSAEDSHRDLPEIRRAA